jgi:hypothetical protein
MPFDPCWAADATAVFLLPQGKKEAMQDALICLSCYSVVTDGGLRGE